MIPRRIAGASLIMGAPKDWDEKLNGPVQGLAVRVEPSAEKGGLPLMKSAWEPTPAELAMLNAGGSVILTVVGGQPPVWVEAAPFVDGLAVGDPG